MDHAHRLIAAPAFALLAFAAATPARAQLNQIFQQDPDLLRCESVDSREVTCAIPAGRVARFERQESSSPCTLGQTYSIGRDVIVVNRGCRATFRLADAPVLTGGALTAALRAELASDLAHRLRDDYRLGSTPTVSLQTDRIDPAEGSQVRYSGNVRVDRSGRYWKSFEFASTYDTRTQDFGSLTYHEADMDSGDADARRALIRAKTDEAIEAKLRAESRNSRAAPQFEILTDEEHFVSTNQTALSGTGRIRMDGGDWRPVTFESVYDWRAKAFRSVTYRNDDSGGGVPGTSGSGTAMDEDVEAALMRALAQEVRRQKGDGVVQVVVNRRYRSDRIHGDRNRSNGHDGDLELQGKFGYSFNDGSWVTRGYDATLDRSGTQVREVRIFRVGE
jgi:hypothetical protein